MDLNKLVNWVIGGQNTIFILDTPSSGDYKGFNDLYNFDTHLYAEIDGMRESNYPDLVQDYVHIPFDTTLHRERKILSEEEEIDPYSITTFYNDSVDNKR